MMDTKRLTTLAMLSCLAFVGRILFSFLPNVQPMTVIIMLVVVYFGTFDGWIVAVLSLLMSNIQLGMGVWTLAQLVSYSIIVVIVGIFAQIHHKKRIPDGIWALIAGLLGLTYGFAISLVQAPFFGWASFFPYWIAGIPYDLSHAFGNFSFFLILHPVLKSLLVKQKIRIG